MGFADQSGDLKAERGIEARGGLIEDEELGFGGQGPGQGETLALPAGEVAHAAGRVGEPHGLEQGVHPRLDAPPNREAAIQAEGDVFPDREVLEESALLEDDAQALQQGRGQPLIEVPAEHFPSALEHQSRGVSTQRVDEQVEEHGFPRPARPHQADQLAGSNGQIESPEHVVHAPG